MAPYRTSAIFVMAPYFHQLFFAQSSAWSRMDTSKKAKKVLGPVSIQTKTINFSIPSEASLAFSSGCVGAMVCVKDLSKGKGGSRNFPKLSHSILLESVLRINSGTVLDKG